MRSRCLVILFLAGLACRQTAQSATPPATAAVTVGPDDPVISLDGFCAGSARPGGICKTIVTRAQFEKLTEALQPGMSPALRLSVANAYARNLRMSAAAEKRGLDKTAAFDEEMRFARMQLLAQDLNRVLKAEAEQITDTDLSDYYQQHLSSYEQATVARIFVPHAKLNAPASEPAMTQVADDLRARAVNGENPDQLQIDAYAEAGSPRASADTTIEKLRRAMLPPAHETVLDLKPGEVSAVFSDPGGGHFIYKMIGKQTLPLEDVVTEVRTAISSQRYRDSVKDFQGDVVFSDAYFNPPGKPGAPPRRDRRAKPPNSETYPR